jgi:hypothetical protein
MHMLDAEKELAVCKNMRLKIQRNKEWVNETSYDDVVSSRYMERMCAGGLTSECRFRRGSLCGGR